MESEDEADGDCRGKMNRCRQVENTGNNSIREDVNAKVRSEAGENILTRGEHYTGEERRSKRIS